MPNLRNSGPCTVKSYRITTHTICTREIITLRMVNYYIPLFCACAYVYSQDNMLLLLTARAAIS